MRIFSPRLAPVSGEPTLSVGTVTDNAGPAGPFPDAIAMAPDGSLAASPTYVGDSVYISAVRVGPRLAAGASSAVALWQNAETTIYVRPIAVP